LNNFQKETLKLLKIDSAKFIDSNKFRHIEAEKLIAVSHPNYFKKTIFFAHSKLPIWIIHSLKKIFKKKKFKKIFYKKIFIDRSDSIHKHCKLINNNEVINFLQKKGFKILQLSKINLLNQISIFKNCKEIIAPHGAGLANLVFCKKGTKVFEIIPKNIKNNVYRRISKTNKLNHTFIYLKNRKNDRNGDMFLKLKELNKFV
jgi:capsular polysaccharide biosynthesis protein